jgi:hypothetical protein
LSLRPAHSLGRHPFSRSYGANLPNSLTMIKPTRLSLFSQGHLCQISVRTFSSLFTGSGRLPNYSITDSPRSHHYGSPGASPLRRGDGPAQHSLKRQVSEDIQLNGTGILTCFPVVVFELRYDLGPTNPRLTNIVEET